LEIPLALIDDNPFNARLEYDPSETQTLADSFRTQGLLCPIKVRKCGERFQVVYGHRRVRAARLLNWPTITGEITSISDSEMLSYSLVENLSRKDLSDYEKAVSIKRLHCEFLMSYERIGELLGYSKSHVCEYVSMLELFDEATLLKNSWLRGALQSISEHHARVLRKVEDTQTRISLLRLVIDEGLSVRDLQRIIQKLSGLFGVSKRSKDRIIDESISMEQKTGEATCSDETVREIEDVIRAKFTLPREGDFDTYATLYHRGNFSALSSFFPSLGFVEKDKAIKVQKDWFYSIAPKLSCTLRDIRTHLLGQVAIVTLIVDYEGKIGTEIIRRSSCGTIVLVRTSRSWKIVHEHYSKMRKKLHLSNVKTSINPIPEARQTRERIELGKTVTEVE
jgi:ParB family chromosome partitioning protein